MKENVRLSENVTELDCAGLVAEGIFDCSHTKITSLKGSPSRVEGHFMATYVEITSLEGAPSWVGGNFNCYKTKITSLHNIHKIVRYIGGDLVLPNTIRSHMMGIMLIKGVRSIGFTTGINEEQRTAATIINLFLMGNGDVHACQEKLFEAGLAEYAKL